MNPLALRITLVCAGLWGGVVVALLASLHPSLHLPRAVSHALRPDPAPSIQAELARQTSRLDRLVSLLERDTWLRPHVAEPRQEVIESIQSSEVLDRIDELLARMEQLGQQQANALLAAPSSHGPPAAALIADRTKPTQWSQLHAAFQGGQQEVEGRVQQQFLYHTPEHVFHELGQPTGVSANGHSLYFVYEEGEHRIELRISHGYVINVEAYSAEWHD